MTADEFWAALYRYGFTKHQKGGAYTLLQGADGDITGIPDVDGMTAGERVAELARFKKMNMLD